MPRSRRELAIEDARLLAEHHIAGVRYTRAGRRIKEILHPRLGWISPALYLDLEKTRALESTALEVIRGGYALNAAIYAIAPTALEIPIPVGPALLAAAVVDLIQAMEAKDMMRLAKAAFKIFGPFGAALQAIESMQGTLAFAGELPSTIVATIAGVGGLADPCAPTTLQLLVETLTPGGHLIRAAREAACADRGGSVSGGPSAPIPASSSSDRQCADLEQSFVVYTQVNPNLERAREEWDIAQRLGCPWIAGRPRP